MDAVPTAEVIAATDPRALELAQVHGERWRHRGSAPTGPTLGLGVRCPFCGIEVAVVLPGGLGAGDALALLARAGTCRHAAASLSP